MFYSDGNGGKALRRSWNLLYRKHHSSKSVTRRTHRVPRSQPLLLQANSWRIARGNELPSAGREPIVEAPFPLAGSAQRGRGFGSEHKARQFGFRYSGAHENLTG